MDRTAVIWTRAFGDAVKIADIVHTGSELRLTYTAGAPCGVTVVHSPKRLAGTTISYPVDSVFQLPPFLSSLLPQRGGAAWLIGLEYLAKSGKAPAAGDEFWHLLLLMGRDAIGHLDVFAHDGLAERWYGTTRPERVLGDGADRRGIWDSVRDLGLGMIQSQRMDALTDELGPSPPGITGMIPKLLMPVDAGWLGPDSGTIRALVKTEPLMYAGLLALEERCYRMHEASGCKVPRTWLRSTSSGSPLLVSERFDRKPDGTPIPCESMLSVLHAASRGTVRHRWSAPSATNGVIPRLELVANALSRSPVGLAGGQEKEFFKRLCMALATGNSDLHLENISVLGERHEARFTPIYDPAPMRAWPQHAMTLALSYGDLSLTTGGRHIALWDRTLRFGTETLGLRRDQAVGILVDCRSATKDWPEELAAAQADSLAQTLDAERNLLVRTIKSNGGRDPK